ncbi:hypothetical protein KC332_g16223 [Hortaea werneckii]|nr:hypothetical protein KC358_g16387 [Hortaea werneckii]KAI6824286.1 hypothetical protein KC350_g9032 [Hortaea werneckii]KAI6922000.1 hypothetical protein KC348_g9940 [Hortaea werneckii]KAI6926206.1 hypothetical protein KC341_g12918 [Hortaea werneckii]KAI6954610.1 hypothetical protein KC321_g16258 [Hortaea werneckii]
MAQVPERVLSWLYSVLHEYHDPQRTYTSVAQTLSAYPTLSPRTEVFTNETGRSALLLVLSGTLPTHFRGAEYRFPVKIWFPHTYPHEAPMVFVTPGGAMAIRPGQHVGTDGRVYHPYLRDWRGMGGGGGWEDGGSNLGEFLRVLIGVFEREPPVTHGGVHEPQHRQAPPPVEMSATTKSPPPPPKPPKPGQEPVFPERSTSRNLARDGPPLPPLPHERVGSAQYAASPPPSTPMYPNRTASTSRPPPTPQGMSGYEATLGQYGPPATPLAHQQFQQVRAAAGREGSPVSPMMPNGQGFEQRFSQQFMPGMQGNSQHHPGGGRASFQHHPNHHQPAVPSQQPYHHQGQRNSTSYQQYPPNQPHPHYHYEQQHPPPPQQIPPAAQSQKPPPPPDLLTTDPFEISLPTDPTNNTATHPPAPAPPIPPNPEKEHLLSALATTLAAQSQSKVSQNLQAFAPLQAQNSALRAAIGKLEKELQGLDEWSRILDSNEGILRRSIAECEGVVGRYKSASTTQQGGNGGPGEIGAGGGATHQPPIDEILVPPTLVANQLWTLCAEEASCREAMYVLQQAVDRGRVGGRDFVRLMRGLGREAFLKKALARKCARGLGLE